jgi:SAM-dependent methyltransferase
MFEASADFYDAIYGAFKDYRAEAAAVARRLRQANSGCRTVLDVGCGTGEHARLLAEQGFLVDGLDLDGNLLEIARKKHPVGSFLQADMSDFQLSRQYDAVICLFSSIGYLKTLDRVALALRCFREHLAPGGVIMVEPWFAPGVLDVHRVGRNACDFNGMHIVRTATVEVHGRLSRLRFDYEITEASGVRRASEVHELGLFTAEELLKMFQATGLQVDYDSKGLSDRGLYVAVKVA